MRANRISNNYKDAGSIKALASQKMKNYIIPENTKEINVDSKGNVYALKTALVKDILKNQWRVIHYYLKLEEKL